MIVTLEEAKLYLRVDSDEEDDLIRELINSATNLVKDISRLSDEEFDRESAAVRIAILYAVAYLYENRENAAYKALTLTLRSLLFGLRQVVF